MRVIVSRFGRSIVRIGISCHGFVMENRYRFLVVQGCRILSGSCISSGAQEMFAACLKSDEKPGCGFENTVIGIRRATKDGARAASEKGGCKRV